MPTGVIKQADPVDGVWLCTVCGGEYRQGHGEYVLCLDCRLALAEQTAENVNNDCFVALTTRTGRRLSAGFAMLNQAQHDG